MKAKTFVITSLIGVAILFALGTLGYFVGRRPVIDKTLPDGTRIYVVDPNAKVKNMGDLYPRLQPSNLILVEGITPTGGIHPSCFLRIDGHVFEPAVTYYDDEDQALFTFDRDKFPPFFHHAEIGIATGPGIVNPSLSQTSPKPSRVYLINDPANSQVSFELPLDIQRMKSDISVKAKNQRNDFMAPCGTVNHPKSREFCFNNGDGQTATELIVSQRAIHWFNLPFKP